MDPANQAPGGLQALPVSGGPDGTRNLGPPERAGPWRPAGRTCPLGRRRRLSWGRGQAWMVTRSLRPQGRSLPCSEHPFSLLCYPRQCLVQELFGLPWVLASPSHRHCCTRLPHATAALWTAPRLPGAELVPNTGSRRRAAWLVRGRAGGTRWVYSNLPAGSDLHPSQLQPAPAGARTAKRVLGSLAPAQCAPSPRMLLHLPQGCFLGGPFPHHGPFAGGETEAQRSKGPFLGRISYTICGTQCEIKVKGPCSKIVKNFPTDSQALSQLWALLRAGPRVSAQVTQPLGEASTGTQDCEAPGC